MKIQLKIFISIAILLIVISLLYFIRGPFWWKLKTDEVTFISSTLIIIDLISLVRKMYFYSKCTEFSTATIIERNRISLYRGSYVRYKLCYEDSTLKKHYILTKHLFLKRKDDQIPIRFNPQQPENNTINKPYDYAVRLLLLLLFLVLIFLSNKNRLGT